MLDGVCALEAFGKPALANFSECKVAGFNLLITRRLFELFGRFGRLDVRGDFRCSRAPGTSGCSSAASRPLLGCFCGASLSLSQTLSLSLSDSPQD